MAKKVAKKTVKKPAKKKVAKKTTSKKNYELPPVVEVSPVTEIPEVKEIKTVKNSAKEALLENFLKSNEVMKTIRSQFGYSGYSNPNYIGLSKQIDDNEAFIKSLE